MDLLQITDRMEELTHKLDNVYPHIEADHLLCEAILLLSDSTDNRDLALKLVENYKKVTKYYD